MTEKSLQQFFLLRITECFNKNTIDSYRVRSNNAITLLLETQDVVESWCEHKIKSFETVAYVLEECVSAIEKAQCLTFESCPKELFLADFEGYKKTGGTDCVKANHLLYYIESCIEENSCDYLRRLFTSLTCLLVNNEELPEEQVQVRLESIDRQVTELACELIRVGYSKIYLFYFFQDLIKEITLEGYDTFMEKFDKISQRLISCQTRNYSVLFVLSVPKEIPLIEGWVDAVPQEVLSKVMDNKKKQLKPYGSRRFYIKDIEALDEIAAIKKVREEISEILDFRQSGPEHQTIRIPYNAFVGQKDEYGVVDSYKSRIIYSLDVSWLNEQDDFTSLPLTMEKIETNQMVDSESRSRLKSALRHLRIGDGQLEIEQRFINYWIGLEFLFSSPEVSDSTFVRMKKYLIDIMASCYIKRNIMNLVEWMSEYDCRPEVFQNDDSIDSFISNNELNTLMFYRLKRMKSHLHSNIKTEEYIKNHKRNLEQHLSRLYRLRNELVHEGAIKHDMENVTSNLRYYLVFILNQCLAYFSHERVYGTRLSMDTFFWEYEKYLNIFSLNKKANFKYEYLMQVPLANKFLR